MHVYFTKAGKGRWGWGVGVKGHAHRYVLILPAKRVFLFFGVKASLGDDSSSQKKKKKKKRSEHIIWANRFIVATELFPFLMKRLLKNLFPGQFVPLHCASLQCIVLRFFFFFFFFQPVRKTVIAMKRIWWYIIYISSLQSSEKL